MSIRNDEYRAWRETVRREKTYDDFNEWFASEVDKEDLFDLLNIENICQVLEDIFTGRVDYNREVMTRQEALSFLRTNKIDQLKERAAEQYRDYLERDL